MHGPCLNPGSYHGSQDVWNRGDCALYYDTRICVHVQ